MIGTMSIITAIVGSVIMSLCSREKLGHGRSWNTVWVSSFQEGSERRLESRARAKADMARHQLKADSMPSIQPQEEKQRNMTLTFCLAKV